MHIHSATSTQPSIADPFPAPREMYEYNVAQLGSSNRYPDKPYWRAVQEINKTSHTHLTPLQPTANPSQHTLKPQFHHLRPPPIRSQFPLANPSLQPNQYPQSQTQRKEKPSPCPSPQPISHASHITKRNPLPLQGNLLSLFSADLSTSTSCCCGLRVV